MPAAFTPFQRFHRLAEAAAFLGVLFTLAGLLGRFAWFLELFTHFKIQLAVCFVGYAALEFVARRRRRALASLAFAAINAVPILVLSLPVGTGATPAPASAARLRILQANILSSNTNAPALLALVARENPDVVVLEEPTVRWLRDLAPLSDRYPIHAARPREDNFGAAIFCKTNARSAEIFLLSDPEEAPSSQARIGVGDKTITVVGTHPLAPCCEAMWRGRNAFTHELALRLKATQGPLVVTGDFNNTPWSATFQDFLATSGLRDSAQGHGPLPTWPTANPLLRIPLDHCFVSRDVQVIAKRLGPDIGSDHLPLIIDIAF
mgnify:CR=1 FL=1